ncbi:L,D-transpeptidase [Chondromyces crocatus]|uniref:L,D-TPase catalytic domain-containing protein n=1 Tax=Chondromyces crocatus TaxID=52 RepID=A0A0K1EEQ2_CHOCO|nr:L,D-transpeptidase [Chondromyces crocatus]AKT39350.1 uncharacterized protein CMC5_034970 [Chondromyces crocatus]
MGLRRLLAVPTFVLGALHLSCPSVDPAQLSGFMVPPVLGRFAAVVTAVPDVEALAEAEPTAPSLPPLPSVEAGVDAEQLAAVVPSVPAEDAQAHGAQAQDAQAQGAQTQGAQTQGARTGAAPGVVPNAERPSLAPGVALQGAQEGSPQGEHEGLEAAEVVPGGPGVDLARLEKSAGPGTVGVEGLPPELLDDGSDELPKSEPPPPEPTRTLHELASVARETWVFAEPRWGSRRLGYLRAGAIVERRAKPAGKKGCQGGWYGVQPHGYVCVGATATLDIHARVVEASRRRPTLGEGLPYTYVMSRSPAPLLYGRLPEPEEQRQVEKELGNHLQRAAATAKGADFVPLPEPDPTPPVLLYGQPLPALGGDKRDLEALVLGRAQARSGHALLSTFDHEGRRFGLTTEMTVLPLDRTRVVRESAFTGVTLGEEAGLPVAFVRRRRAVRLVPGPTGGYVQGPVLGYREGVPVTGEVRRVGGVEHRVARDGSLVRVEDVVMVEAPRTPPTWAASGRKWIDVSILRQSLVAYEGTRPVFATLVSTGADGLGDPKKTRSTIQGAFLIHTKHVTVKMSGDADDEDRFDFRDVPFVQYFTEGYALHAAYWHDEFGTPRSHGCINLSPRDAAWLFGWTTPDVPAGWHAALSLRKGTLVYIHP